MGLTEFEQEIYTRIKPLGMAGVSIATQLPIRVREPNKFFPKGRSLRCSFLCTKGDRYAVLCARSDFPNDWLLQLELLSANNPAALQNLIVVCPSAIERPLAIAQLIVVYDQEITWHLLEKLAHD